MTFDTSNESGEGLCADYTGTKGESAAAIIDQSARACKVSQKVLLTVMQKEQHLVTAVDPSDYQLMAAMGVELSGYRRLRSRLCRILSAGVWRGQAVPLLSRARGTVRVYGAQSQLHPISSEHGMRRRTSVYREQGDRPALHLYALPAEHRRTGRWQRYRRFLLQLWQPQLRAYLHQLVRFAAKLITAADRSCPIDSANTVSVRRMDAAGSWRQPPAARRKPADTGRRPARSRSVECGSMVPRHDLCRPACRRTGCSTGRRAVNHQADADIAFGHADFVAHDRRKIRVEDIGGGCAKTTSATPSWMRRSKNRRNCLRKPIFAGCELRGRDTAIDAISTAVSTETKAKVTRQPKVSATQVPAGARGVRRCVRHGCSLECSL